MAISGHMVSVIYIGTLVDTLPDAWCHGVSARIGSRSVGLV